MNDFKSALDWSGRLLSILPTDPNLLARVAQLYQKVGDRSQAFHYYSEVRVLINLKRKLINP
jgi:hypothetical protein